MAENSAISWCKSTFNPWIGCTAIGPGCDNCYAEELDRRRFSKTLGGGRAEHPIIHFGHGAPRYRTSISNWNQPLKWNKLAPNTEFAGRKGFWPVFCASLADVFDNEVPDAWRDDLFRLIAATPNLTWLLVTKRVGNIGRMLPASGFLGNVWPIITCVNQVEIDRDLTRFLQIPAVMHGVSYEPAIGPATWHRYTRNYLSDGAGLDWVIVGGESKQGKEPARPFEYKWALDTINELKFSECAVFVKQMGSNAKWGNVPVFFRDGVGADPKNWPMDLRVQEFPL